MHSLSTGVSDLNNIAYHPIYAFLAFWGFSTLLARHASVVPISRGVAAVVLIGLGVAFLRRRQTAAEPRPESRRALGGSFFLGFSITALNPTLIATWSAAATTLFSTGLVRFTPGLAPLFAGAASVGIVAWFAVLLWLIRHYRERFRPQILAGVLRVMGVFLIAVGLCFGGMLVHYLIVA